MSFDQAPITELDLMAHADGRLDPVRRRAVDAHLAENPSARALVESFVEQNESLRRSLAPIAAEPVPDRLTAVLMASPRRSPMPLLQAAAVFGLALVSALGGWWLGSRTSSVAATPPAFLVGVEPEASPVIGGLRPLGQPTGEPMAEVAGSTETGLVETAAPWFTDRVTVELRAPALGDGVAAPERQGLVEIDGRPTLRFALAGPDGRSLALYLQTRPATATPDIRIVEQASGSTAYWQDGPLLWALTGASAGAELEALARHIGTAIALEPRLGTVDTEHTRLTPLPLTLAGG